MPTTTLMPLPKQQYLTVLGTPLVGGKVYTYAAGGTTPKPTYTDSAGTTPQPNPIPLNLRGEPASPIFWSGNYRVEVRDALNNLIYSVDNYNTDPAGIWAIAAGFLGSMGSALVGFIGAGAGAIATTVLVALRFAVRTSGYDTFQNALQAAASTGKILMIDSVVTLTANQIVDISAATNVTIMGGGGRIVGPAVAVMGQPSAYLKMWGTLDAGTSFNSTIAEAASTFAVAQTFAPDDMLMLSNFPTDATDAFTEGGADPFGEKARSYANLSTANLRQTRRKEILVVRTASAGTFTTETGTSNAYGTTAGLKFQKATPVRNVRFIGVTFQNVGLNMRYTRDVSIFGCTGLATAVVAQTCLNTRVDFDNFDSQDTDCRVDMFEACRGIHLTGRYAGFHSPSDNGVVKMLGCTDFLVNARIDGCIGNGVMVDTAFVENPSGYSDLPAANFDCTVNARGCTGAGFVATCNPYAATISYGTVHYTSDDCGVFLKGANNIDLHANISYSDGSNNSVFLYGATNTNLYGKQRGGIYTQSVVNPRDNAQSQATANTSRIGSVFQGAAQPGYIAYLTAPVAAATGDGTEVGIPYNSELIDKTNSHTTGLFVAPYDGLYRFDTTVKLNGVASVHTGGWLRLFAGGASFYYQPSPAKLADAVGNCGMSFSAMAYLNAGQTAQMFVRVDGGTKVISIQGSGLLETFWSGTLLN